MCTAFPSQATWSRPCGSRQDGTADCPLHLGRRRWPCCAPATPVPTSTAPGARRLRIPPHVSHAYRQVLSLAAGHRFRYAGAADAAPVSAAVEHHSACTRGRTPPAPCPGAFTPAERPVRSHAGAGEVASAPRSPHQGRCALRHHDQSQYQVTGSSQVANVHHRAHRSSQGMREAARPSPLPRMAYPTLPGWVGRTWTWMRCCVAWRRCRRR